MPCALCLQDKSLCESHIIPEFAYESLYDEKHKMWKLSTERGVRTGRLPKGIYEQLLCKDCEDRIGAWETYARQVIYGGVELEIGQSPFGWQFLGVDYERFKLFQLSLLWRAAVSKRPEFNQAHLARKPRGRLRQMLLDRDPGEVVDFACMMFASRKYLAMTEEMVLMPLADAQKGSGTCLFVFGGLFWLFSVPCIDPQAEEYNFVVSREGRITIVHEEQHTERFLAKFALDLKESGNLPSCIFRLMAPGDSDGKRHPIPIESAT